MDAVIPPPRQDSRRSETRNRCNKWWFMQPEESREPGRAGSKTALERRRVRDDPNTQQADHDREVEVEDLGPDSEDEEQDAKGIPWILETLLVRSLLGDLDQCIHLNYKINPVLMILKLHKHLEKKNHKVAYTRGIYLKTPSSIRTWLLNYKPLNKHWKEGSLNRHV